MGKAASLVPQNPSAYLNQLASCRTPLPEGLGLENLHTLCAGDLHHVRRADAAGERDYDIRLALVKHLSVADRSCRLAVLSPIGRVALDRNQMRKCPLIGEAVSPTGATVDDNGRGVVIQHPFNEGVIGEISSAANERSPF